MKKNIWSALSYTCVSFTIVSVLLLLLTVSGLQPQLSVAENLQLLLVCVVLSTTQVVFNLVPAIEANHALRALINVGVLMLLGGWLFGWFEKHIISLLGGAVLSGIAYLAVWTFEVFRLRQDAREINDELEKRRQQGQPKK